ncbi:MAG: ABC transporter ATP-binding protein [Bacteroidales bacterium]|nr:ABC transporter ATP-binding protein [Bacteroidales bacterium]
MNDNYIAVKNVSKSYNDTKALNKISFFVNKAEIFGFIGPDGAGKTTLFRIITTLLLADSGSVTIDKKDVVKEYKEIRRIIGYMPGRFSLYYDLTVEENLTFFATVFNTTIEENYNIIKDIYSQIEPFKTRRAGKLSGGMKQKLALCCALIHKPDLLVLDEPTTGVDAVSRREFWEILKNLQNQGITIIVSTPYMDEASKCDRVALIQEGEILKIDTPENIVHDFDKVIYSVSGKNVYQLLIDLRKFEKTKSAFPFGHKVHLVLKDKLAKDKDVTEFLEKFGHEQIQIANIMPSIEDCFMDLMEKR